jgi:hypothetical protein
MTTKVTHREQFLVQIAAVVPWGRLPALNEPCHPKTGPTGDRPRMTEERKGGGGDVDHPRCGRMLPESGVVCARTCQLKTTTDSDHRINIAPTLLNRDFIADRPHRMWAGDSSDIWTREG